MNYLTLREELLKKSSLARAKINKSFFKTGKGDYSEGDVFIGVRVPDIRGIANQFKEISFEIIKKLLESNVHEERHLGLVLLVERFNRSDFKEREKIVRFYLKNRAAVNNWDLVDLSAPYILGVHTFETKSVTHLEKLLLSDRHWDRRIAIVSTWYHIRQGETKRTFHFASKLLNDPEDLMHKATGWMLREAGKKDLQSLKKFIHRFGKKMPRTMLRYAIEKFSQDERKLILLLTKN